ncbi:MAG TPA: hypothetical protein VF101_16895, partial [Gaiellaceae bacterium]
MTEEKRLTRVGLLRAGATSTVGLYLAGCGSSGKKKASSSGSAGGGTKKRTVNMLTWSDHYANDQLAAVQKSTGIRGRPQLFSDNADAYLKIKQTGSQFDIVSGDALWVPKYNESGLTESFDL